MKKRKRILNVIFGESLYVRFLKSVIKVSSAIMNTSNIIPKGVTYHHR